MSRNLIHAAGLAFSTVRATGGTDAELDSDIKARLACQVQGESHMYDLRDLQGTDAYQLSTIDPNLTLYYNFCHQIGEDPEDIPEEWCLKDENDPLTFAYLKDSAAQKCYALTTESLYPTRTDIEDEYNPEALTLFYQSDTICPFKAETNFSITYYFQC